MSGILVNGHVIQIPGVTVIPPAPLGPAWCSLDPRDYRVRSKRARQVVLHATKGDWPQYVRAGAGPGGKAKSVAGFWRDDPNHSAAHIVIDNDGTVACLADLALVCAYHATVSNEYSVGIELYQESDGGIYEAVYDAAVKTVPALLDAMDIPFYVVADPYTGHPLTRFLDGAPDFYGVLGHRNNTEQRGRGDPGDEIFARLIAAGGEPVIAGHDEDLEMSRARQRWLISKGDSVVVDGLAGPKSLAAARQHGFARWSDVPRLS